MDRGFHMEQSLPSAFDPRAISFQSGTCNSQMIPVGSIYGMNDCQPSTSFSTSSNSSCSNNIMLPGSTSMINNNNSNSNSSSPTPAGMVGVQPGNSAASSLLLDSVPGLKHDAEFAVEWSVEEQYKLEEGLHKYADEPSIMKYIKIAAFLRDKTVRDVALRCRWMMRKRRKGEEYNVGKKVNNKKDKLVESSSAMNIPSSLPQNMATYPLIMQQMNPSELMHFEGISGRTRHLLEQNAQAFHQITANLSTLKLQENIDLFFCARTNIVDILNEYVDAPKSLSWYFHVVYRHSTLLLAVLIVLSEHCTNDFCSMRETPGIMSQMPPLPVSINEDLANSILPLATQSMIFGSAAGMKLKQEPRC